MPAALHTCIIRKLLLPCFAKSFHDVTVSVYHQQLLYSDAIHAIDECEFFQSGLQARCFHQSLAQMRSVLSDVQQLLLQLEALDEVERAFVHVDYTRRDEPEHKVERNMLTHPKDLMLPHQAVAESSGSAADIAGQARKAAELNDHLQQSNSVSDQAKLAAQEAISVDIREACGDDPV